MKNRASFTLKVGQNRQKSAILKFCELSSYFCSLWFINYERKYRYFCELSFCRLSQKKKPKVRYFEIWLKFTDETLPLERLTTTKILNSETWDTQVCVSTTNASQTWVHCESLHTNQLGWSDQKAAFGGTWLTSLMGLTIYLAYHWSTPKSSRF